LNLCSLNCVKQNEHMFIIGGRKREFYMINTNAKKNNLLITQQMRKLQMEEE